MRKTRKFIIILYFLREISIDIIDILVKNFIKYKGEKK